jgi:carbon-monoxide dehydrogenase medium subunit
MSRTIRSATVARSGAVLPMPTRPPNCPASRVTCEGEITLLGPGRISHGTRPRFFHGAAIDTPPPDEIVTELHLPKWSSGRRWALRKYARREGDFALAGILLFYDEDRQGALSNAHLGVIGACPRPHRLARWRRR